METTEPPAFFIAGSHSARCNYCCSGSERETFDLYGQGVSGKAHRHLIHRGFRRCGSLFYLPRWDSCCRLIPTRCYCDRSFSQEEVKILKRLRRFLANETLDADTSGTLSRPLSPNDDYLNDDAFLDARIALSYAVMSYIDGTLLNGVFSDTDRAKFNSTSIQFEPSKKISHSVVRTVLLTHRQSSKMRRFSSGVAIALFGLSKKYRVSVAESPHQIAKHIRNLLQQQYDKIPVMIHDNGYLEVDIELEISPQSTKTPRSATTPLPEQTLAPKRSLSLVLQRATFKQDEYELFSRYQKDVHDDPSSPRGYTNFLCDSCLICDADEDQLTWRVWIDSKNDLLLECDTREMSIRDASFLGSGTFHLRYEATQLIAVSVLDVLPDGLSSVYFFYDTELRKLSLGTLSGTLEMAIIDLARRKIPSASLIHRPSPSVPPDANSDVFGFYYLGYFIPTCPKMAYKSRFAPSFLLCPDTNQWVSFEKAKSRLDSQQKRLLPDDTFFESKDQNEEPIPRFLIQHKTLSQSDLARFCIRPKDSWWSMYREFITALGKAFTSTVCFILGNQDIERCGDE